MVVTLLMEWDHTLFIGHPTRFLVVVTGFGMEKQKQVPQLLSVLPTLLIRWTFC